MLGLKFNTLAVLCCWSSATFYKGKVLFRVWDLNPKISICILHYNHNDSNDDDNDRQECHEFTIIYYYGNCVCPLAQAHEHKCKCPCSLGSIVMIDDWLHSLLTRSKEIQCIKFKPSPSISINLDIFSIAHHIQQPTWAPKACQSPKSVCLDRRTKSWTYLVPKVTAIHWNNSWFMRITV